LLDISISQFSSASLKAIVSNSTIFSIFSTQRFFSLLLLFKTEIHEAINPIIQTIVIVFFIHRNLRSKERIHHIANNPTHEYKTKKPANQSVQI